MQQDRELKDPFLTFTSIFDMFYAEIRAIERFENWNPGDPTPKLFVKNLSPKVTESDLRFVFGRFSKDPKFEDVQIRLMTRGKLHGQAFVTFSDATAAQAAISEVSGYVLHDRPMILVRILGFMLLLCSKYPSRY